MLEPSKPKLYNPRHPERTLLYQTVAEHYETWLELASAGQFDGQGDHHSPKPYVCQAFAKYLECGIFAHGFARCFQISKSTEPPNLRGCWHDFIEKTNHHRQGWENCHRSLSDIPQRQ